MFRNVYFIQCTESISLRKFLVVLNAEVYFLPGFTKVDYFIMGSRYLAFVTLYAPEIKIISNYLLFWELIKTTHSVLRVSDHPLIHKCNLNFVKNMDQLRFKVI